MMFNFKNTAEEISIMPYYKYAQRNLMYVLIAVVVGVGVYFIPAVSYKWRMTSLSLAGVVLFLYLWDVIFKTGTKIIFDKRKRIIYKSYSGLLKVKRYHFDQVMISFWNDNGSLRYGIANKKNRYGKYIPLVDDFKNDAEQKKFENEILPVMNKLLG